MTEFPSVASFEHRRLSWRCTQDPNQAERALENWSKDPYIIHLSLNTSRIWGFLICQLRPEH